MLQSKEVVGKECHDVSYFEKLQERIEYNKHILKIGKYSQHGEEGILEYLSNLIGTTNKICVEFGACDGKQISNTLYFEKTYGWQRILFEADQKYKTSDSSINFIALTPENINQVFEECGVPFEPELVSIDIDSYDFWIWKAMQIQPKMVIIEINHGLKNSEPYTVLYGSHIKYKGGYAGANFKAMYELGKSKGYHLITMVGHNNLIFLREDLFSAHNLENPDPKTIEKLMNNASYKTKAVKRTDGVWINPFLITDPE